MKTSITLRLMKTTLKASAISDLNSNRSELMAFLRRAAENQGHIFTAQCVGGEQENYNWQCGATGTFHLG